MKTILLFLFLGMTVGADAAGTGSTGSPQDARVCVRDRCFQAAVMATPDERAKGLMSRPVLFEDEGMLFVFDKPGEYPFWMKNMNFPIDIIWLNEARRVVHIEANVPPCKKDPCPVYHPHALAQYALEIADGQAEALGLKPLDQLSW